jgi:hypothetical protein
MPRYPMHVRLREIWMLLKRIQRAFQDNKLCLGTKKQYSDSLGGIGAELSIRHHRYGELQDV